MHHPNLSNSTALLRPWVTGAAAAVLVVMSLLVWGYRPDGGRTGSLLYPAESAGRMVERNLSLYSDYDRVPAWQKRLFALLFGDRAHVEHKSLKIYRDVLAYFAKHPDRATPWAELNTRARLIVLLAEMGDHKALQRQLNRLGDAPEEQAVAEAVAFAYRLPGSPEHLSPIALAGLRLLPLGWAANHMWWHAAQRDGDARLADRYAGYIASAGDGARRRVLLFAFCNAALLVGGLAVAAAWLARGAPAPGWRAGALEQPWSLADGFAVAVRAAVLGLLIFLALALSGGSIFHPHLLALWSGLFASLPMMWLIHRYLLRPRGLGFTDAFGLRLWGPGLGRVVGTALAVLALEQAGSLLIAWGAWQVGFHPHWSEAVPERLIWGPWQSTVLGSLDTVVWGPVFEEIGFRGLIFVALRSRLGFGSAALLSSALFAILHPYSLPAMAAVFWSGLVWAWAFERLRSLLPGMLAHAGTNLLAVLTVVLFYR
ncbi:MAG TPA: type II CAAX endopeptidase family protein [Gammaproteobacteria bacterium]|nr:type II CAAX endopeptidase family protein [Gammaproteobacteria bacterium]